MGKSCAKNLLKSPWTMPTLYRWILALVSAVLLTTTGVSSTEDGSTALKGVVGGELDIPCLVINPECGSVHSIRWYHNKDRIYVYTAIHFSHSLTEGHFSDRTTFRVNDTPPVLHIQPVQLKDEGTYKCEITYISLNSCPTFETTQVKTIAKPNPPQVYLELPDSVVIGGSHNPVTATTVGPFREDEMVRFICVSRGGKPAPQVTWWNGSQTLDSSFSEEIESDGTSEANSTYSLIVSRSHLLARLECQVTHETLKEEALVTWVQIDVHVPPKELFLEGDAVVNENEEITLVCKSVGARPAAKIIWYNGSEVLDEQPVVTIEAENGQHTFTSSSKLTFTASRYDDEETIRCDATNEAMRDNSLQRQTTLTVYYSPVVRLSSPDDADGKLELTEGGTLRLNCDYEANPAENISEVLWLRNGHVFHRSSSEEAAAASAAAKEDEEASNTANNGNGDKAEGKEGGGSGEADKEGSFHIVLTEISRRQSGEYSCQVQNSVGRGVAENIVNVSVLFAPQVELLISPPMAVEHVTNVTLTCDVEEANPEEITKVRWFRDSILFEESEELVKVLELVKREDHRNYSCQAQNKVGWGAASDNVLLNVIYTPGRARIAHRPMLVIKDQPVTILCELDDPGNPPATDFTWKRGEFLVTDVVTYNWSMPSADLQTQDEYFCIAQNAAGEGIGAKANIEVNAAPSFITALLPSTGALETAKDISLTCQVECYPRCSIDWFKNGELLTVDRSKNGRPVDEEEETVEVLLMEEDGNRDDVNNEEAAAEEEESLLSPYAVKVSYLPPNFRTRHFSSVVSTLRWNMSAWNNKRLDRMLDVANYTCKSSPTLAGIGVNSTTLFYVEYPPENVTLSTYEIEIEEGQILPSPVTCHADGKPEISYLWTSKEETVSGTNELKLDFPASRHRSGVYTCTASNKHGKISTKLMLDVQFKPECKIHASIEEDGSTLLTCEVDANPEEVNFVWLINNETVEENIHTRGLVSRLKEVRAGGKYFCLVNNSIGPSEPCSIELQGAEGALIAGFGDNRIVIIVVVVAAIIIISVIVCIVIVLVMKRRGSAGKLNKPPRSQTASPADGDRAFYENLPFHGLQPAPNKATNVPPSSVDSSSSPKFSHPPPTRLHHQQQQQQQHPHQHQQHLHHHHLHLHHANLPVATSSPQTLNGGGGSVSSLGIPTREGVVYADLALSSVPGSVHSVVNRRDRPTEYAVLAFSRDNTASEV